MSDSWPAKPVGPRITELGKSTLPAGLADDQGAFPFFCSSPQVRRIDRVGTTTSAILMGTGGVATVHLGQGAFSYSTDTWAFTVCDPLTDLAFLYRQLEHRLPQIDYAGFGGSGLRHLDKEYIRRLLLPVPNLQEQALVARMLNEIDIAIDETEAIIAKLKAVKRGLLHDLLTRGIDANGELRPSQAEAPHLYKQSPLGWIPKKWSVMAVGTLLSEPPQNGLYKPPHLIGRGALLVGQTAFTNDGSVKFEMARRAQVGQSELSVFGLQFGDLLVSRVFATLDGVGQPVVVPDLPEAAVYESNMMRMRPKPGVVTSTMLFNLLKLPSSRAAVRSRAFLSNQASINRKGICSVALSLPPWEEQLVMDARFKTLTDRLGREIETLMKYRSEKAGLMDDLLTGRVRVTPLLEN